MARLMAVLVVLIGVAVAVSLPLQEGGAVACGLFFSWQERDSMGNSQALGNMGESMGVLVLGKTGGILDMTNEELASIIQSGERDKVLELWEQVRRFRWKQARRWASYRSQGQELGDLVQVGFLVMLDALESWKSGEGSFLNWYSMRLKAAFTEATGQRTQQDRMDPLQTSISLEMPLNDGKGKTLYLEDIIPDRAAEWEVESVVERDFARRRREAVWRALAGLQEEQRRAVVLRYWAGQPVDTKIHREALRELRRPVVSLGLRKYL